MQMQLYELACTFHTYIEIGAFMQGLINLPLQERGILYMYYFIGFNIVMLNSHVCVHERNTKLCASVCLWFHACWGNDRPTLHRVVKE